MDCCDRVRDNWEMLRSIYRTTGARDDFPIRLPSSLVWGEDGTTQIQTQNELILHLIVLIDELAGEFPIKATLKSGDTEESQEVRELSFPNIAETLAEIATMSLQNQHDIAIKSQILLKIAVEVLNVKAATLVTQGHVKAQTNTLGINGNTELVKVPCQFNFEGKTLNELLEATVLELDYFQASEGEEDEDVKSLLNKIHAISQITAEGVTARPSAVEKALEFLKDRASGEFFDGENGITWEVFLSLLNEDGFINRGAGSPRPKAEELEWEVDP